MAEKTATMPRSLVEQLADRVRGPSSVDEPYIIQDHVAQTHSRHAVVIWDAWDQMDRAQRGRVIVDAFAAAGARDSVRVAMGLTQQEALSLGYLPYQIVANCKKSDGAKVYRAVSRAIEETGGVHVRTGASVQLRYPTLEHAKEAYRQLSAAVPGPYWAIIKEDSAGE